MAKIAHFAYNDLKHDITVVVHDEEDGSGVADGHTIEVVTDFTLDSGAADSERMTMKRPKGVTAGSVVYEAESKFREILYRRAGLKRFDLGSTRD